MQALLSFHQSGRYNMQSGSAPAGKFVLAVTEVSSESALVVLQRMAGHVRKASADLTGIQTSQARYEESVARINSIPQQRFERLHERRPGDDARSIETEIIQYACERTSIETDGLKIAENACKNQIVTSLQALSDRLVATLHPYFFQESLQKLAAGTLKLHSIDAPAQVAVPVVPHGADISTLREVSSMRT